MADEVDPRWLLLIHQIPPKPNYLRVKAGRQLQRLGSVALKNSVYVLPKSDQAQEDFQWVLREIEAGGGEGSVCEVRFVEGVTDRDIEGLFHAARNAEYLELAEAARKAGKTAGAGKLSEQRRTELEGALVRLRKRLDEIAGLDFFGAPGRESVEGLLSALERRVAEAKPGEPAPAEAGMRSADYQGRTWVTRSGIHVDRMGSAWLVRRFIDPKAKFKYVPAKGYRPQPREVRFDMFEAEFTHEGDRCTFEVLVERFALNDPALKPLAELIHDIDLKDSKFAREEVMGLDHLILGIAMAHDKDEDRLARGAAVFDDYYEYFRRKRSAR